MRPIGYYHLGTAERRRRELDRIDEMTAKDTTVSGRHLVYGVGGARFEVDFPVTFARKPVPSFGAELDEGQEVIEGAYPGAHACVVDWKVIGKVEGAFPGYYVGAYIAVTTIGGAADTQQLWVNYSFRGIGLRNPVQMTEDIDEEI